MKQSDLKYSCLIAVLYFGMNVNAQTTPRDTVAKEQKIEEVVMIGYGSRKKVDNTTSVSSINSEELTKTKVLNATQAIQGKAAGVQVTASDLPGSTPTVMIRGLGTVLGGRTPLYVVDGLFVDNINNINSNDILTYDILKDASALAIYGNRGANGVIIITTKSGKGKRNYS
ncbi:TonB-dependent receptor plug domain-containing protein [Flavobacterium sp. B17]|uniref:TonB-dependent receptor plug domain-containing protein n=1 Tax=Flavobacterium sp. B17 TaxID=95618 RepID=UPI00034DFC23|nr:TonB-dependent receptor plug domain-containing protein [Flavobacterium sp. B17]